MPRIGAPNRMPVHGKSGCDDDCAEQQHEHLDGVRVEHRPQAAEQGVYARRDHDDGGACPEIDAHQRLEHDAAGRDGHRDLGQHVTDDRYACEVHARSGGIAALEELRHREHAAAQIERHEKPAEQQQHQPGDDLELRDRDAGCRSGAGKTHQVLGADIRREQRGADDEPAGIPPRKEETIGAFGALAASGHDGRDDENQHEVQRYHRPIECRHGITPSAVSASASG
jgi:hypothetical protein